MVTLNQNSKTKDDNPNVLSPQQIYSYPTMEYKVHEEALPPIAAYADGGEEDDDDFYHVKQCTSTPITRQQQYPSSAPLSSALVRYISSAVSAAAAASASAVPLCRHLRIGCGHSCSSKMQRACGDGRRWCLWLIMVACVLSRLSDVKAAPQSCILCDKNDLMAKTSHGNYEEYLFEHQVTRHDAINALKQLNESFYEGQQSDSSCNAVSCTEKVMKYCLGSQFINDHCLCEVGHSTEGLPFVPHICYVGEKLHTASVGSCFFYEEVKECCCSSLLAKEWRHISSSCSLHRRPTICSSCYFIILITLLYLLIRR